MKEFANSDAFNHPRPARPGRHDFLRLLLVLVGVGCALYLATAVFAPWGFYLGGHRHPLPIWQGRGTLHAPAAGGDYTLYVYLYPSSRGSRMGLSSNIAGSAYLCTPRGEKIGLKLTASMPRHPGTQLIGTPISLYLRGVHPFRTFTGNYSPRLNFKGTWGDRSLLLSDAATLSYAFNPDGTMREKAVYPRTSNVPSPPAMTPPIALQEVEGWGFGAGCPMR